MTAPDPGLTDLIAAHTLRVVELNEAVRYPECNGCDWVGGLVKDHAKHLALVVEQHTQTQTARITEERLAEAIKGMDRLITKLDETANGLGDWNEATEYIQWARKEVQEIYLRAALEGEQQ